ncbi:MAG: hypothetical protein K2N03_06540 [Muribaculaceae bacterium]|nr:hypothetical protein [Muribaculaceae bacterium]
MKRILLTFSLIISSLFLTPFSGLAQHKHHHRAMSKEIQEFKIKYLASEIDLADSKLAKFSDICNEQDKERAKAFSDVRKLEKQVKDKKNAAEEDYLKLSEAKTNLKLKMAEIEKKYDEKFSSIISQKQLYKLREAESTFRKKMHRMRKEKRNGKK